METTLFNSEDKINLKKMICKNILWEKIIIELLSVVPKTYRSEFLFIFYCGLKCYKELENRGKVAIHDISHFTRCETSFLIDSLRKYLNLATKDGSFNESMQKILYTIMMAVNGNF